MQEAKREAKGKEHRRNGAIRNVVRVSKREVGLRTCHKTSQTE